jgi:hypothetical protein
MADGQLKLSRRALLGAVCAAPVLAAPSPSSRRRPGSPGDPLGAPPPRDPGLRRDDEVRWQKALARLRAAQAALAAAEKGPETLYNRLGARHHSALARLLTTPAPDIAALAAKLDLALYDRAVEFTADAAAMKAIKRDAHRLAAAAA